MEDETKPQPQATEDSTAGEDTTAADPQSLPVDDLDIDAALAAVSRLGEIAEAAERAQKGESEPEAVDEDPVEAADEAEPIAETAGGSEDAGTFEGDDDAEYTEAGTIAAVGTYDDADYAEAEPDTAEDSETPLEPIAAADPYDPPQPATDYRAQTDFSRPPLLVIERGQLASVLPALILIGAGAGLTFALTTGVGLPSPLLLLAGVIAAAGVIFISLWLSTERGARGSFFIGSGLLLCGVVLIYLFQPGTALNFASGWSLLFVALGAALALTGFITRPRHTRLGMIGVIIALGGIAATGALNGQIDPAIADGAVTVAPFVLVFLGIIMLLPLLARRRNRQ